MGIDIWDKCIPQEVDRTAQAICFTKGCYLGQETIARLDALGQIQKKLSIVQSELPALCSGSQLLAGEKEVGRITSSVQSNAGSTALAVLRRGFYEPGTELRCGHAIVLVIEPRGH
jgi:folate-binding protein YgfZ